MRAYLSHPPVLDNWHGPHSQLAILDPGRCFGHLTRFLGRILLLHIADGTPASTHHGLHHLHVLVHGGHVGHARAVHHPLHHRAHRLSWRSTSCCWGRCCWGSCCCGRCCCCWCHVCCKETKVFFGTISFLLTIRDGCLLWHVLVCPGLVRHINTHPCLLVIIKVKFKVAELWVWTGVLFTAMMMVSVVCLPLVFGSQWTVLCLL